MSISLDIKNYSIALEALSRINHPAAHQAFEAIEGLLSTSVSEARKEQHPLVAYSAPAKTTDDDIPF